MNLCDYVATNLDIVALATGPIESWSWDDETDTVHLHTKSGGEWLIEKIRGNHIEYTDLTHDREVAQWRRRNLRRTP